MISDKIRVRGYLWGNDVDLHVWEYWRTEDGFPAFRRLTPIGEHTDTREIEIRTIESLNREISWLKNKALKDNLHKLYTLFPEFLLGTP